MANQSASDRNNSEGTHDVTKSDTVAAPQVVDTVDDVLNQHGPGSWDDTVYGADPYASSTPTSAPLNGAGPAQ